MCGRFAQVLNPRVLDLLYRLNNLPELEPCYNLAPSRYALAVRERGPGGSRELVRLQWGFIPAWVPEKKTTAGPINARAETVMVKPYFRRALRQRRALIPASGYYEWRQVGGKKQPYYIRDRDNRLLSLAALWERWEREGVLKETFALITTAARGSLAELHHRMPLILPEEAVDPWLAGNTGAAELQELLQLYPAAGELTFYPVSPLVNNPLYDSPACLEPLSLLDKTSPHEQKGRQEQHQDKEQESQQIEDKTGRQLTAD